MKRAKLIIKYKDKYIVSNVMNEINFIEVPIYDGFEEDDYNCIDMFISLLCSGYLSDNFTSTKDFTFEEELDMIEIFLPECLTELGRNKYIYDLDKSIKYSMQNDSIKELYLKKLPGNLEIHSYEELMTANYKINEDEIAAEKPRYITTSVKINNKLQCFLKDIVTDKTENSVLLLYSGGRDSTLSAIRLVNSGYNVHFIHFNNGYMRDADKPFTTYEKLFWGKKGYYFNYEYHDLYIYSLFNKFYLEWIYQNKNLAINENLKSEMRCLSCRLAMYIEIIKIAKMKGIKYIADGARNSQLFMIEQDEMIARFQELANSYGIELLCPVIKIADDSIVKQELIDLDYSSKTWESKCLLGKPAMNKSQRDIDYILDYYDNYLKPKLKSLIRPYIDDYELIMTSLSEKKEKTLIKSNLVTEKNYKKVNL